MIHTIAPDFFQHYYPSRLVSSIMALEKRVQSLFLAGGAVRDILMGQKPIDLDLTVSEGALGAARFFASHIKGNFVLLDEGEEVARVVWQDFCVDFTTFRQQTKKIEEDLILRDFTINAMAFPIRFRANSLIDEADLIDPCAGLDDLKRGIIKCTHEAAFTNDPLRIIRAYRFFACLGYTIEKGTETSIANNRKLLGKVSPERISSELHKIIMSNRGHNCFVQMAKSGVLSILFPEIEAGQKIKQPGSHHLDVFEHNLAALDELEKLVEKDTPKFLGGDNHIGEYLNDRERVKRLKWAAFFHDLGKPVTHRIIDGKITFYGHDNAGADLFVKIARRLKWSKIDTDRIAQFIKHHMWLFHLTNAQRKTGIKAKACLKIHKVFGAELSGLYLLSLADSLAAKGADKPEDMEKRLTDLYRFIREVIREKIDPILLRPGVLNGKDLITYFNLSPGPLFGKILLSLEKEQVTNGKMTKEEALKWVEAYLVTV